MGGIRQRGQSFEISYRINGKRRFESLQVDSIAEAEAILLEREAGIPGAKRQRGSRREPGIYFVREEETGLIKVGCSGDVPRRIAELQASHPFQLTLIARLPVKGFFTAEKIIHRYLHDKRARGEWFHIGLDDIEAAIRFWALESSARQAIRIESAHRLGAKERQAELLRVVQEEDLNEPE
jgi:Meiotically up-regulated gene 113